MRVQTLAVSALALSLGLSGCGNTGNLGNICERPLFCVLGAAAVIGAIILIADDDDDDNVSPGLETTVSDLRLKRDIRQVSELANGVKLYSFRYWNDERVFIGASAQELLQDPRFRHAVTVSESGYYLIDYGKLGARITGDVGQYQDASRRALEAAKAAS